MSRILIIEDDPDLVALVRRWLERDGHLVEHVADGAAALFGEGLLQRSALIHRRRRDDALFV